MTQKLATLIREGFSSNLVFAVKSKKAAKSEAMRRAWRTRKRMAQARANDQVKPLTAVAEQKHGRV